LHLLVADLADPVAEEGVLFREVDNHGRQISGKPTPKILNCGPLKIGRGGLNCMAGFVGRRYIGG
jgi:hypothetical protein